MTGVQFYRRALVSPALVLVGIVPAVLAYTAAGTVALVVAGLFGGSDAVDAGAKPLMLPILLLLWAVPTWAAYLLVTPFVLRRVWQRPERAYRKLSARLPLLVLAVTFLITAALTIRKGPSQSAALGLFVAVPGAIVAYAYWAVAGVVLKALRAASLVEEPAKGGPPRSRGVVATAIVGFICGAAVLAAVAVAVYSPSSDAQEGIEEERRAEVRDTSPPAPEAVPETPETVSNREADPTRAEAPAPKEVVGAQQGALVDAAGSTLVVRSAETGPPVGTPARLSERVTLPIGGNPMWVEIARVRVAATDGDLVTLEVLEEKSVLTVNDRKHDYFTPGSEVRLQC